MFVDLDNITFIEADLTTIDSDRSNEQDVDMDALDVAGSCDQDLDVECDALEQSGCPSFQACVPYLSDDTPPHCLERVQCVSRFRLSYREVGSDCEVQHHCGIGAVCTSTRDNPRRRCVAYCRVANPEACAGNTTCTPHFADQIDTAVGLCE